MKTKKQTKTKTFLSKKNKTKISPEMVHHMKDNHNSSKTNLLHKKTFVFANGPNRPGVNRPVRKMVLERTVPGGTGFGANRPVPLVNELSGHTVGL